jgi:hypothetical protein
MAIGTRPWERNSDMHAVVARNKRAGYAPSTVAPRIGP